MDETPPDTRYRRLFDAAIANALQQALSWLLGKLPRHTKGTSNPVSRPSMASRSPTHVQR